MSLQQLIQLLKVIKFDQRRFLFFFFFSFPVFGSPKMKHIFYPECNLCHGVFLKSDVFVVIYSVYCKSCRKVAAAHELK